MSWKKYRQRFALLLVMTLVVAACGAEEGTDDTDTSATTAAPTDTTGVTTSGTTAAGDTTTTTTEEAGQPQYGGSLTIGVRREAGELDIHKPSVGTTRQYARALYHALFRVDINGNVTGELVDTWETPDPNTYVFHLRQGILFHDGTEFNAEAVKFNLERILNPDTGAFYRTQLTGITNIEVVDEYTVRLTLDAPDSTLPARLSDAAGWIVSPAGVAQWGDDFATNPVGTGPFEFVEWVSGDHLTLQRNENYWEFDEFGNQLPYLDELIFRPNGDLTVLFAALRAGEMDILETMLASDLATAEADPDVAVNSGPGNTVIIWLNLQRPPFDNKALRQAVSLGVDYQGIHDGIYLGTGLPGQWLIHPSSWAFDPSGDFWEYDPDAARAVLAEAGFPEGFTFTILVNNVSSEVQLVEAIQAQLAEAGITMVIEANESSVNADRRSSGDFEASLSPLPPQPDQRTYSNLVTGQGVNRGKYSNPEVDAALNAARATSDIDERAAFYHQVQAIVLDDAPIVYVHQDAALQPYRTRVMGFEPSVDAYIRVQTLWVTG
jgi:peptide/nickel transport system substrate-binding protein